MNAVVPVAVAYVTLGAVRRGACDGVRHLLRSGADDGHIPAVSRRRLGKESVAPMLIIFGIRFAFLWLLDSLRFQDFAADLRLFYGFIGSCERDEYSR